MIGVGLLSCGIRETLPAQPHSPHPLPAESRIHSLLIEHANHVDHPHCPARERALVSWPMMAQAQGRVTAYVLFIKPALARGLENTDLWQSAASIPESRSSLTRLEAGRFHAMTSGQTVLYDAGGRLLFSGGITGSRGHYGTMRDGAPSYRS